MTSKWDFESEIAAIVAFRDERDWQQFHYPKDLAAAISIEAAELQELFLWKGQESAEQVQQDAERMSAIADEVADVAIYLFLLANGLNINLREAIDRKIEKNAVKYPSG
jgi:NTP pyrophosphatase (non-canonical NTP hydrolase)